MTSEGVVTCVSCSEEFSIKPNTLLKRKIPCLSCKTPVIHKDVMMPEEKELHVIPEKTPIVDLEWLFNKMEFMGNSYESSVGSHNITEDDVSELFDFQRRIAVASIKRSEYRHMLSPTLFDIKPRKKKLDNGVYEHVPRELTFFRTGISRCPLCKTDHDKANGVLYFASPHSLRFSCWKYWTDVKSNRRRYKNLDDYVIIPLVNEE